MALLLLEALAGPLACADARLYPRPPAWLALPDAAA
jgi:hypothetical protein